MTGVSTVITEAELKNFSYVSKSRMCGGCTSNCNVNVIRFSDGRKFISGNKCEKGAGSNPIRTNWISIISNTSACLPP